MNTSRPLSWNAGFTLLELLVVVVIISILAAIILSSMNGARERANDAEWQGSLRTLETALALYRNKYGQYPTALSDVSPEFVATIANAGQYTYTVNSNQSVFQLVAPDVAQAEVVTTGHEFYRRGFADCPAGSVAAYEDDYAVSGGFSTIAGTDAQRDADTVAIRCG